MLPPSGDQFEIAAAGYRAVVTESGAALRVLEHDGRPLVAGFPEDAMADGGRGQILMPWPNRIRDGRYDHDGTSYQLAHTEPARANASHGLARWVAWTLEEHTDHSVSLRYRCMAQAGYPWTLDLAVVYDLSADGLTVTQSALNQAASSAPYASGAHPYLCVGDGLVDDWELLLPARTRYVLDERLLPVGRESVEGTPVDFRVPRPIRDLDLDAAFTDLARDEEGRSTVELRDPSTGAGVAVWLDAHHHVVQLFTARGNPATERRSLAIEPMTAPADAFNSGEHLVVLAPGEEFAATWGVRAV
ncbi:aldose 1-epimerase family protein [Nocardioides fonticola]|uniref:Aldose 1-epimerase family protein n=1 Tax=Nocardioides fonticola TaxID=450363 RepID=A0ABP7XU06_9ACTN